MTAFGDPWLRVVRETMRGYALARVRAETIVEIGRLDADGVILGASALPLANELGSLLPPAPGRAPA
jgi:hypothetical protein